MDVLIEPGRKVPTMLCASRFRNVGFTILAVILFVIGSSAWIYWNMILDETGGPWAISPIHGNPDPNKQHPVVIINRKSKQVTYTGLYYYLTHFSKFVRPGAVRVQTSGSADGIRAISFALPDGSIVSQLINSRKEETALNETYQGRQIHIVLPAISITTVKWKQ